MKRIAVLGGGAAGLVALRHLLSKPNKFHVTAFEQTSKIGGTWVYTDKVGTDEQGLPIHSSMYSNMLTNLPKEVMAFPDFPFPKSGNSFLHHTEVLHYLENYADKYNLRNYIQFNTRVDKIDPVTENNGTTKWEVGVRNVYDNQQKIQQHEFDAVLVCSGHFAEPHIPSIPGQSTFQGEITHSHDYRHPDSFADKVVLFLGAGPSGQDIALDVAPAAKKVYLSHNKDFLPSRLPENVVQTPGITAFKPEGVVLTNGDELVVDAVVLCTGYKYSYPFLSKDCNLVIKDGRITPLYKHVIHTQYPSLRANFYKNQAVFY